MRRPSVQPLAAFALWLVARYAAEVEPDTAGRWLAQAERIVESIDSELWPECVLRDETLAVLGIADLGRAARLDAAARPRGGAGRRPPTWLAGRDPDERAPRQGALLFSSA